MKSLKRKPSSQSKPQKQLKLGFSKPLPTPIQASDPSSISETHILSWNVNGLRSFIKKPGVLDFINRPELQIICLNETKLQECHVPAHQQQFPNFPYQRWSCSKTKLGYSGTAILSKIEPLSWLEGLPGHAAEGRLIVAEFSSFYLVVTYVPNSGSDRLDYRIQKWDADFREFIKGLEDQKPVVWIGDMNVINEDSDVYRLEGNEDCAGGTPQERESFWKTLKLGFVDSFKLLHPNERKYSWFNVIRKVAKSRNEGWRFDMAIVSEKLKDQIKDSLIYDQVTGSDHYPIELILRNSKAT